MFLKSCLNGSRSKTDHRRCPITAAELAADAAAVVAVGIQALHVHPRNDGGEETLEAAHITAAMTAIRQTVTVPTGISTGAWFLTEPADRLRAIERWTVLPDFASVNFHEPGATEIARLLLDRGIGVEAGLWNVGAARSLMHSDIVHDCVRVLFEPMEQAVADALANLDAMEAATHESSWCATAAREQRWCRHRPEAPAPTVGGKGRRRPIRQCSAALDGCDTTPNGMMRSAARRAPHRFPEAGPS